MVDGRASLSLALAVPGRDVCEAQRYYRTVLTGESLGAFAGVPPAPGRLTGFFTPWVDRTRSRERGRRAHHTIVLARRLPPERAETSPD